MCLSSWISKSSANTTHFEKYLLFYVFMRITATIVANNGYNSGKLYWSRLTPGGLISYSNNIYNRNTCLVSCNRKIPRTPFKGHRPQYPTACGRKCGRGSVPNTADLWFIAPSLASEATQWLPRHDFLR